MIMLLTKYKNKMYLIHSVFLGKGIIFVKCTKLCYCHAIDPYGYINPETVFPGKVTCLLISEINEETIKGL